MIDQDTGYVFKAHEQPILPGSPHNPAHPLARRLGYFAIGVLIGIAGGLGSALIQVNLAFVQGSLSLGPEQGAWLLGAYYMVNVTANLLLLKFRQQFGLMTFIRYVLAAYALSTALHLVFDDFASAIAVRAISGLAGTGLSTLTILYVMQSVPADKRLIGAMVGISLPQLATPLARIISPSLLEWGDWRATYRFELGLALATLAAVTALPLPPNKRERAFEPADFLTFALLGIGLALLVAICVEGRLAWWTDSPWIGIALAVAVGLIAAGLILEHGRVRPLIDTHWLGTRQVIRLMLIATSVRILLSEQAVGSVGLLNVVGMGGDQLVTLNLVIVLAGIAGMVAMVLLFRPREIQLPIMAAVLLIAIGAFIDAGADNLTRPANLYLSQALIGFASIYFLGSAMAIGISRTLLAGPRAFISYVVLFSLSQSLGGLVGSALLGTFQTIREKFHSHELVEQIRLTDPVVSARLGAMGHAVAGSMSDPARRQAEAIALLGQQVAREANILAFNDVFVVIGLLALATLGWGIAIRISNRRRKEMSPVLELMERLQRQQQISGSNS